MGALRLRPLLAAVSDRNPSRLYFFFSWPAYTPATSSWCYAVIVPLRPALCTHTLHAHTLHSTLTYEYMYLFFGCFSWQLHRSGEETRS